MSIFWIQSEPDKRAAPPSIAKSAVAVFDQCPFLNQAPDNARDRSLTQSGHLGQFRTRNLIIVQADGLQNIKTIDVTNDGWTSCGHRESEPLYLLSYFLD